MSNQKNTRHSKMKLRFCYGIFFILNIGILDLAGKEPLQDYHSLAAGPNGWYTGLPFDANGVPRVNYSWAPLQYNPGTIAQYGIVCYDEFITTGDTRYKDAFLTQVDYLMEGGEVLELSEGKAAYKYHFQLPEFDLKPGWVSCLAQGLVTSLMVRAHHLTGNRDYLQRAKEAINCMVAPIQEGGTKAVSDIFDFWLEEYPTEEPSHVLNGYIFGYIGLLEYSQYTEDQTLPVDLATQALLKVATLSDIGCWTTYGANRVYIVNEGYMALHISQMEHVYQLTGIEEFQSNAQRWKSYLYLEEISNVAEGFGAIISEITPTDKNYLYLDLSRPFYQIEFLRILSRYGTENSLQSGRWLEQTSLSNYRKIFPARKTHGQFLVIYKKGTGPDVSIQNIENKNQCAVIQSLSLLHPRGSKQNTLHCELSHGKDSALYEFWMKAQDKWSIIQPFSTSPSVDIEFEEEGSYAFSVTAKLPSDTNAEFKDVRTILYEHEERNMQLWAEELDIPPTDFDKDLDGDGANQYVEYIYGTNPRLPDSNFKLKMEILQDGQITFLLKKPVEVQLINEIVIQESSDLKNWSDASRIQNLAPNTENYRIQAPIPSNSTNHRYYRAMIQLKYPL